MECFNAAKHAPLKQDIAYPILLNLSSLNFSLLISFGKNVFILHFFFKRFYSLNPHKYALYEGDPTKYNKTLTLSRHFGIDFITYVNLPTGFCEILVPFFFKHEENESSGQVIPAMVLSVKMLD